MSGRGKEWQKAREVELLAQGHTCMDCFWRWSVAMRARKCYLGSVRDHRYYSRPMPEANICWRWCRRSKGSL